MNLLIVACIFLLAFFLRYSLHFKYKWVGLDTFFHLLCSIKARTKGLCRGRKWIINDESKNIYKFYPPLLYYLLSWFPKKNHSFLQILSTLFDLLTMVILFVTVDIFIGSPFDFISLAIYAIAPISILASQTLNPRTFSNFILSISLVFLFLYFHLNNFFYLFLFALFSSFVLLSHKLRTQSLAIIVLAISLVFRDAFPLLAFAGSFVLALIISKGKYRDIFKSHLDYLKIHLKKGHYKYKTKRPENPLKIFFSFPFVIVPILNFFYGFASNLFFQAWFFSILLASFFWIWGDGYRYLISAVFPGAILSAIFLRNLMASNVLFFLLIFASFIGIAYIYRKFIKSRRIINKDFLECCNYVQENSHKKDRLAVFFPSYWYVGAYFTELQTYPQNYYKNDFVKREDVTWIITDKKEKIKDRKNYKLLEKKGKFKVFKKGKL